MTTTLQIDALKYRRPYALLILDLSIHGGRGAKEVIQEILAINPDTRAAVFSGNSTDPIFRDYRQFGFAGALKKPFKFETFQTFVLQMLAESEVARPEA